MATKILSFLYLGNDYDAELRFEEEDWKILSVLENPEDFSRYPTNEANAPVDETVIPILDNHMGKYSLNWNRVIEATDWIERTHMENPKTKILLHCAAGQERSPLVMQYYLVRYQNMGADEAFNYIKKLRPEVFRCDKNYLW